MTQNPPQSIRDQQDTRPAPLDLASPLIAGFGMVGRALAVALTKRGFTPTVFDDRASDEKQTDAEQLGCKFLSQPTNEVLSGLVAQSSVLLPSPGIPDHHPVFELAARNGVVVASELDLAQVWDDRPTIAITGTNGKTTVTTMLTAALNSAGISAEAVGNTDVPYVAAIDDAEIEQFVVECSSFRLDHSATFAPKVAAWINFAPDHLDAHSSLEAYREAKASIWRNMVEDTVIIVNADDPVVMEAVAASRPRSKSIQTFSLRSKSESGADWYVSDGVLTGSMGSILETSALTRQQPHDIANALVAVALATAIGADTAAVVESIRSFGGLPHRLEFLGSADDVDWYNDSKATVPHATVAAVGGFDSVVLIAGGKNKGLALEPLRETVPPVRAVVAIGDAAGEVAEVFDGIAPVSSATSMEAAVDQARQIAIAGDVVLLSPACTSFDWYDSYVQRGLAFSDFVTRRVLKQ